MDSTDLAVAARDGRTQHARSCYRTLGIVIPTCNAESHWPNLRRALELQGVPPRQIVIIDSSSTDKTPLLARESGYTLVTIPRTQFGHGRTRQLACSFLPEAELLLFLTQDAVPDQPDSVLQLCAALDDPEVGAAFGRQLPRPQAKPIERHARLFNYPKGNSVRSLESRKQLGIKAAFFSNSFGLYRRTALENIGGFPDHVIHGEDTYAAGKLLLAGWKVTYQADATVIHSHDLSYRQEFSRYFDTGVHHAREAWLLDTFGAADSEGLRFVRSELSYLRQSYTFHLIPSALLRTGLKLLAYKLGRAESLLSPALSRRLSSNTGFWHQDAKNARQLVKSFSPRPNVFPVPAHADEEKPVNATL